MMSMSPLPLIISGSAPDKSNKTLHYPRIHHLLLDRLNFAISKNRSGSVVSITSSSSRIEVDTIGLPNCRTISNTISLFGTRIPTVVLNSLVNYYLVKVRSWQCSFKI
jgi:hypothetical protein